MAAAKTAVATATVMVTTAAAARQPTGGRPRVYNCRIGGRAVTRLSTSDLLYFSCRQGPGYLPSAER